MDAGRDQGPPCSQAVIDSRHQRERRDFMGTVDTGPSDDDDKDDYDDSWSICIAHYILCSMRYVFRREMSSVLI